MTIYASRPASEVAGETSEPGVILFSDDMYSIIGRDAVHGFVHRVGNVFVALSGTDANLAFEIGQSLSWDEALAMIERAFRARVEKSRSEERTLS